MNKIAATIGALYLSISPMSFAQTGKPSSPIVTETLALWPEGKMPGKGAAEPEMEKPPTGDNVQRITNVSQPTLTVCKAPGANTSTPVVVICPGGGYGILAFDKEGTEIAAWFNSIGITGVVLKYRTPDNREGAFQDIQRAVRLVRAHAKDWGSTRVGVMGFSAGGHLCARLSTNFDKAAYPKTDDTDALSCRPDFTMLVYPAYLADPNGQLVAELPVNSQTPPTFIVHTDDDQAFIVGSRAYQAALQAANVSNEFCHFATGGHGYGMRSTGEVSVWPQRAQDWLRKMGIIGEAGTKK